MDPRQCCEHVNPACDEAAVVAWLVLMYVQVCWDEIVGGVPSDITHLLLVPVAPARAPQTCCPPGTVAALDVCVEEPNC